jgi:hypothetical protein
MGINLKNAVVSTAVAALVIGLISSNVNAITATATYGSVASALSANGVSTTTTSTATTTITSRTSLDAWIDKLAEKESGNKERIKILDVNGRYSYGCLQFQMATFKSYSQRYGLVDPANVTSWEETIYNCSLQKQIAKRMLLEKSGNWRHWGYTVRTKGLGLPPKDEPVDNLLAIAQ